MADLDGDGKPELLTGTYEGNVYVLAGKGKGEFGAPVKLLDQAGLPLRVGMYWDHEAKRWQYPESSSKPHEHGVSAAAVDWDGDGDVDLVLGTTDGRMYLHRNLGNARKAAFSAENEPVLAAGAPLALEGGHAMPVAADWDGDGKWDLVSADDRGSVSWWRNVGEKGKPSFAAAAPLVPISDKQAGAPGVRAQATVCDFDGDGKLDLLLGDYRTTTREDGKTAHHGNVWFYRRL